MQPERHAKSLDLISRIATVGPPVYVLFRLATGDRGTWMLYLAVFIFIAVFYAVLIVPGINWDADDPEAADQPRSGVGLSSHAAGDRRAGNPTDSRDRARR